MSLSEFSLIDRYFLKQSVARPDVTLGIGDDCALLEVPDGKQLAVTADTMVEGRHFLPDVDPAALGHKLLAVNLSDLAAMGAEPAWATLALTLPEADEAWLEAFSIGFMKLAEAHGVQLVGGDTTRGPLTLTLQLHGFTDKDAAIRRDGATPGDLIYVTGTLGDAGLALLVQQGLFVAPEHLPFLRKRLDRPTPRVELGRRVVGLASSGIDISDGLAGDLNHICERSGCGATLELGQLPCSAAVGEYIEENGDWSLPLTSGDDYELCLTVPERRQAEIEAIAADAEIPISWIGAIEEQPGVRCRTPEGDIVEVSTGFDHFSA